MPSARSTILDAVQAALVSANVSSSRVYRGRHNEVTGANLPVTYLYPIREEIAVETIGGPRVHFRTLALAVDHWAKAATPELLEEALDVAEDLIVGAIVPLTSGVASRDNVLTSAEWSYEAKEDAVFGCARITFNIIYQTTH